MTDLRQAAQQALKALEHCCFSDGLVTDKDVAADAILAIKQALAQPEQEPVAWMYQHDETGRMNYVSNDGVNTPEAFVQVNPRYALVCALYAMRLCAPSTPPAAQRPWQGLTDDEILEAAQIDAPDTWLFETAYAIEAKLKERNNG